MHGMQLWAAVQTQGSPHYGRALLTHKGFCLLALLPYFFKSQELFGLCTSKTSSNATSKYRLSLTPEADLGSCTTPFLPLANILSHCICFTRHLEARPLLEITVVRTYLARRDQE